MSSVFDPKKKGVVAFTLGYDFSKDDYDRWLGHLALWVQTTHTNEQNPKAKAENILSSAINGTNLMGDHWTGIESYTLKSRIKSLSNGFDIETLKGRTPNAMKTAYQRKARARAKGTIADNSNKYIEINLEQLTEARERYKQLLLQEFSHLDTEVYETTLNSLCDAMVKLEEISDEFLSARPNKSMEMLLKIREGLKKDIDDFMKLLRIHPSQIKEKVDEFERGDIGALVSQWDSFGETAEIYEKVDAIQELIQTIRQLEQIRVDGSPQLTDWMLWHKTGTKRTVFTCEHGTEYVLYDGFTKEELYKAAEQAYEVFGWGLELTDEERRETTDEAE